MVLAKAVNSRRSQILSCSVIDIKKGKTSFRIESVMMHRPGDLLRLWEDLSE